MSKLDEGDKIKVTGNPLLQDLDKGEIYTVKKIYEHKGHIETYKLEPKDGRKNNVRHTTKNVDRELSTATVKGRRYIKPVINGEVTTNEKLAEIKSL